MVSHYLEIKIKALSSDVRFAFNKTFTRLHGIIKSRGLNIGLSFPMMDATSLGDALRAFGSPDELRQLSDNEGLKTLECNGLIAISPIEEIPRSRRPVTYLRARECEQATRASIDRRERRLRQRKQARGEQWTTEDSRRFRDHLRHTDAEGERAPFLPYALVERQGTKLQIFVRKRPLLEESECLERPEFSSYGLGNERNGKYSAVFEF